MWHAVRWTCLASCYHNNCCINRLPFSLACAGSYNYFLKVVPTSYTRLRGNKTTDSSQYSVTEHFKPVPEAVVQSLASSPARLAV